MRRDTGDGVRDGADVPRRGKGRQPAHCGPPVTPASQGRRGAIPQSAVRAAGCFQDQPAAQARRALRALEVVKGVVTGVEQNQNSHMETHQATSLATLRPTQTHRGHEHKSARR